MVEKGLSPSRLLLLNTVALMAPPVQAELEEALLYQCDQCDFTTNSQHVLNVHKGSQHQEPQKRVPHEEESNNEQTGNENIKCDNG